MRRSPPREPRRRRHLPRRRAGALAPPAAGLLLLGLLAGAPGCGQKGPLYLPPPEPLERPARGEEAQEKEASEERRSALTPSRPRAARG